MRTTIPLAAALLIPLAPAAPAAGDDPAPRAGSATGSDRPANYVGFYRIVSGEDDGEPIPSDRLGSHFVRITEETIVVLDAADKALYSCTYTLDPEARPHRLAMESNGGPPGAIGQRARGIIVRNTNDEGEPVVMLCYRTIGEEYPEEFRTQPQSETNLFVLEPIPDPADAGEGPKN